MDNWYVYIVRCSDDTLYTGITNDIDKRIEKHNSGKGAKYTKYRAPVVLVYSEMCKDRAEASRREYRIKQMDRAHKEQLLSK
ncbi:MAG: GIY-YIG nuclease family protein [Clostridia bacterium]|nr:GIY-YIG nuclease family protein [Clostridia bacterium]